MPFPAKRVLQLMATHRADRHILPVTPHWLRQHIPKPPAQSALLGKPERDFKTKTKTKTKIKSKIGGNIVGPNSFGQDLCE
jgi:hypothetical protein